MNNLCKLALQQGGTLNHLLIPANITGGLGLTNPSIILIDGNYYLNLRHVQYTLYHSEGDQQFQTLWGPLAYLNPEDDVTLRTTNYLCELDPNTLAITKFEKVNTSKLDVKPVWEFIGLEDARLAFWQYKLYLSGVRRDTKPDGEGRMELSEIGSKSTEVERIRIEPPVHSYCEKNWMPILDMPYHYVKWTSPTEVVKVDPILGTSETVKLVNQSISFPRDIRGGSQVITVGDYRIAITHEVDLWKNEQGKKDAHYYHRFIVWDKDWNIVAHSSEFKFLDARIEFSCGLEFDGNSFIIPFGFHDSSAFILKLPVETFEELTNIKLNITTESKLKGTTPYLLEQFVNDPHDYDINFQLGEFYFEQGHLSSALAFYLRSAEFGKHHHLIYESLLMVAKCISLQGRRKTTEKGLWLNALAFDSERPEAYLFLSELAEYNKQYHEAYAYAVTGLELAHNLEIITKNVGYEGAYQLQFQKAVNAWWIGRSQEARDGFRLLVEKADLMNDKYKKIVQANITSLGSGPDPFLRYYKSYHSQLRYKFPGSETIEKNYSQTYQDMFTLSMLNGKRNGTYFEIGAADPFHGSNTALLEQWGWTGTSLEILPSEVEKFKAHRKNEIILCDATKFDYSVLSGHIDYLQIDCEPPETTYKILTMLPWDKCKFSVITFEHDHYTDVSKSFREISRKFLRSKGYTLVASNIAPNDFCPYEDWWVRKDYIIKEIFDVMLSPELEIQNAKNYMLLK